MGNIICNPSLAPILDPQVTLDNNLRYMVRFMHDDNELCGGVFVQHYGFITAAHCIPPHLSQETLVAVFHDNTKVEIKLQQLDNRIDYAVFTATGSVPNHHGSGVEFDISQLAVSRGMPYVAIGRGNRDNWAYYTNILSSDLLANSRIGLGSGAFWGDSGGGVFSLRTGKLIGIISSGGLNDLRMDGCWTRTSPLAWMVPLHLIYPAFKEKLHRGFSSNTSLTSVTSLAPPNQILYVQNDTTIPTGFQRSENRPRMDTLRTENAPRIDTPCSPLRCSTRDGVIFGGPITGCTINLHITA